MSEIYAELISSDSTKTEKMKLEIELVQLLSLVMLSVTHTTTIQQTDTLVSGRIFTHHVKRFCVTESLSATTRHSHTHIRLDTTLAVD